MIKYKIETLSSMTRQTIWRIISLEKELNLDEVEKIVQEKYPEQGYGPSKIYKLADGNWDIVSRSSCD